MNQSTKNHNPSTLATVCIFLLIIAAGLIPRLFMISTPYGFVHDWDWSVFGVQAYDMLQGDFRAYRYGQFYLGSFPMLVDSLNFLIFGPTRMALYIGGLYYWVIYMFATYLLTKRIFGNKIPGLFAAACASITPAINLYLTCEPSRAYLDTMIWGQVIFLTTISVTTTKAEKNPLYWLFLGLCSGICFWTSFLSVYFLLPAFVMLVLVKPKRLLSIGPWAALAGFFVGSTPFWVHNLVNAKKFITFSMVHVGGEKTSFWFNLVAFAYKFKALLGLSFNGFILSLVSLCSLIFVIAAVLFALSRSGISRIRSPKDLSTPMVNGMLLFLMSFGLCAFMYTTSGKYTSMQYGHRYVMPMFNILYPAIGFFLYKLGNKNKTVLLLALTLFFGTRLYNQVFENYRFKKLAVDKVRYQEYSNSAKNLIDYLKKNNATKVCVYQHDVFDIILSLEGAPENISFITPFDKYKPVLPLLMDDEEQFFLLARHDYFDSQIKAMGFETDSNLFGQFRLYSNFKTTLNPSVLVPSSHFSVTDTNGEKTNLLCDRNVNTGLRGENGQSITLGFKDHIELDHIWFSFRSDLASAPAFITIEGSQDKKQWEKISKSTASMGMYSADNRIIYRPTCGLVELDLAEKDSYKYYRFTMSTETNWWLDGIYITEKLPGNYTPFDRKQIVKYIASTGAKTIYADEYTAARMLLRHPELKTFNEYNWEGLASPRKFENRRMDFSKTTSITVPSVFAPDVEKMLSKYGLEFVTKQIDSRTIFTLPPSKLPAPLFWQGITIAEYYEQATAIKLYKRALENQNPEEKLKIIDRALDFNPEEYLCLTLKKQLLESVPGTQEKIKQLDERLATFIPEHKEELVFENGLKVTGYSLNTDKKQATISVTADVNKDISSQSRLIIMGLDQSEQVVFLVETEPYRHRTHRGTYPAGEKLVFTTSFALPQKPMAIWLGLYNGHHRRVKISGKTKRANRARFISAEQLSKLLEAPQKKVA